MTNSKSQFTAPADPRAPLRAQLIELIIGTGFTQSELSRRTDLSKTYLSLLCNYKRYPSLYALVTLLRECGFELKIAPRAEQEVPLNEP